MSATSEAKAGDVAELFDMADVVARVRFSASFVREMVRKGTFPAPVKIGRAARWKRAAVLAWIAEQTARTADRAGVAVQVRG